MEQMFLYSRFLMAVMLIAIGFHHFYKPKFYYPIIPAFFPKLFVTYASGIVELVIGLGLCIPNYQKYAALGMALLMIAFLPLHIWDITREKPAMKTKKGAYIRLVIQFVLIAWAWFLFKKLN
ncbi:hypothetical protein [uncultured Tenacibaculum sp.]|uniref:DoxX family protein n=1 Tax=uncultured Tenacibaculum sp. TaxID=174713 RepID=UPI0026081417|nr:hypothetical protein [uncultured Tenacibaculum sp.]